MIIEPLAFRIHDNIVVIINKEKGEAKIIGYEFGYWLDPQDWIYHIMIKQYPFHLKVDQLTLIEGATIITNGITAKVLTNEKAKVK